MPPRLPEFALISLVCRNASDLREFRLGARARGRMSNSDGGKAEDTHATRNAFAYTVVQARKSISGGGEVEGTYV